MTVDTKLPYDKEYISQFSQEKANLIGCGSYAFKL